MSLTAEEWLVLQRLRAGGVPIEYEHLKSKSGPFHLLAVGNMQGTNILNLGDCTGIAIYISLLVSAPVAILELNLHAHWIPQEISWAELCPQHPDCVCLPQRNEKHLKFNQREVLLKRRYPTGRLPAGAHWNGWLLAFLPGCLPSALGERLEVVISLEDLSGHDQAFPLPIVNREGAMLF
jgi:hypothetical protein